MIQKGDLGNFGGEVLGCHVSSEFVSITLVPIGRTSGPEGNFRVPHGCAAGFFDVQATGPFPEGLSLALSVTGNC